MIAYLVADLLWDSKIRSAAAAARVPVRRVRSWSDLQALLTGPGVRAVLIDLEAEGAGEVVFHARELAERGVSSLAWGPHVAEETLEQARRAGIGHVIPRGRFARDLPAIVASAGGSGQPG